jgi:broad specificity phosphatase PhoE
MFNEALTKDRVAMSRRAVIGLLAGAVASTSFGIKRAWAQPGQLPQQLYIIRHGEKPTDPSRPPFGVDVDGNRNAYSLSPKGWQRAGALTALFSPAVAPKVGLRTPTALFATAYGDAAVTRVHRPYETLLGLSRRLGLPIQSPDLIGQEAAFAAAVLSGGAEVALICYEHQRIPALVQGFPTVDGTAIPPAWPDDRYDVIWTFALDPVAGRYVFGQVPQQLLDGDSDTVI